MLVSLRITNECWSAMIQTWIEMFLQEIANAVSGESQPVEHMTLIANWLA